MVNLDPCQSCPGSTNHLAVDELQDSRSILELLQQLHEPIGTCSQRKQAIMEIIKAISAPYEKCLCLLDAILEESHGQALVSIVPEIAGT